MQDAAETCPKPTKVAKKRGPSILENMGQNGFHNRRKKKCDFWGQIYVKSGHRSNKGSKASLSLPHVLYQFFLGS